MRPLLSPLSSLLGLELSSSSLDDIRSSLPCRFLPATLGENDESESDETEMLSAPTRRIRIAGGRVRPEPLGLAAPSLGEDERVGYEAEGETERGESEGIVSGRGWVRGWPARRIGIGGPMG